jgi:hypothetical protein
MYICRKNLAAVSSDLSDDGVQRLLLGAAVEVGLQEVEEVVDLTLDPRVDFVNQFQP